ERFFDLALGREERHAPGYVGLITANSFMKREFGKVLIEEFFTNIELTHVINTDGAYIPHHGTPTVILFGRNCDAGSLVVRAVLSIKSEPSKPEDASQGKVWRSIMELVDQPGSQNQFVSVVDMARTRLAIHPWSMGGGGAVELKDALD